MSFYFYFSVMHNGGRGGLLDPGNIDAFLTQVNIFVFRFLFLMIYFYLVFKSNGRK